MTFQDDSQDYAQSDIMNYKTRDFKGLSKEGFKGDFGYLGAEAVLKSTNK